jgi:hypothetical protein
MSGFDFGSLRDPDAPEPGASHREGVAMRARELQLRARRGRMLVSGLAIVAVAAAVVGIVATRSNPRPHVSVTGPSTTTATPPSNSTSLPAVGATSTTSTTTTPQVFPSNVVSASFVSSSRGWVVETDGRIDMATNAGIKRWSVVGHFPTRGPNTRIRFANASVGFGFSSPDIKALWETTDGGATWTRLHTPFLNVYDLAISRGVVYAVTFDQAATKFRDRKSVV